ncbi:hypothetical protein [Halorubrum sp. N11]|uniref:hypothetical protein n=1 Tax=Halorubrum sp. N11 TaxID=3402276 RepID=UPI003EC148C5
MTVPTPPTHQDEFADSTAESDVPASFDREFWTHYLRDLCGFDADILDEKGDAWVWARAQEVTA